MAGYNGEESAHEILDRLRRLRAEYPDATFAQMCELVAADRIRSGNPHLTGQGLNRLVEYLKRYPESGWRDGYVERRRRLMFESERMISLTSFLDAMQARVVGTGFKCAIPDCDSCARYDGPDMNEVDAVLEALEKLS